MNNDAPSTDPPPADREPEWEPAAPDLQEPAEQLVEAFPVLAEVVAVQRTRTTALPAVQAAALAATGFVAGAATMALLKRHGARRLAREQRDLGALPDLRDARELSRRASEPAAPGARSTYLVSVRLIARSGD
jgi:hypothetical protein